MKNLTVKGTRTEYNVEVSITAEECLNGICEFLEIDPDYFSEGGEVYKWEDVGFHNRKMEKKFITSDSKTVLLVEAVRDLKQALYTKSSRQK